MSASRDDRDVTREFDDRTADALLGGRAVDGEPELTAFVADLNALAQVAPTPSPALAAMLEDGFTPAAVPAPAPAVRRRALVSSSWARGALVGALALTGMVSAAAANLLPGPAQNAVSDVVGWVTPVDLPRADEHVPAPAPSPTSTPTPEATRAGTSGVPAAGEHKSAPDGSTTGGSDGSHDGSTTGSGSGDSTTGGSADGTSSGSGGSGDSTTGGSVVSGGPDDGSPSPSASPTPRPTQTSEPGATPTPTPTDGGGGSSDG